MFRFFSSAFNAPIVALRFLSLLFAASLLVTTGCWSEVEYEPPKEPAAKETPTVEPPAAEAPAAQPPATELPPVKATPAAPTTSTQPPSQLAATPDEELFGVAESSATATPPADAPPLAETPSPTAEEGTPATEQPRPLLPHEMPSAPSTPPASVPAEGGRYATTPPFSETADESSEATSPVGDRYTTVPATPSVPDDEPPLAEAPASPSSAETPPHDEEPRPLLPHELPTVAPIDASTSSEETTPTEQPVIDTPPAEVAPLLPDEEPAEAAKAAAIEPTNTRHNTWLLGSKWSLMIASEHAGAPADAQSQRLEESQALASALGVELPKTSPYPASQPTAAFLESALPAGRELGVSIGSKHGAEETALLEMAIKSNLLLVLAEARPDLIPAVIRSVTAAAERAQLPADLVEPFAKALAGSPTPEQVDQAVFEFHRAVDEHLRTTK